MNESVNHLRSYRKDLEHHLRRNRNPPGCPRLSSLTFLTGYYNVGKDHANHILSSQENLRAWVHFYMGK